MAAAVSVNGALVRWHRRPAGAYAAGQGVEVGMGMGVTMAFFVRMPRAHGW